MTTQITDHVDAALARTPQQFKGKDNFEDLLTAGATEAQNVEDAFWDLFTLRFLDTAEGAQLDILGAIVGQDRGGLDDDDYLVYIRARILANNSEGIADTLIAVVKQAVNDSGATITFEPQYPAGLVIKVNGVAVTAGDSEIIASLLRDATSAGVRSILETSSSVPANTFTFASERDVEWIDEANVAITTNTITKNAGGSAWNGGAISGDYLNGDGYVEFTVGDHASYDKCCGLSNGDTDQSRADIDFAFYLKADGTARVYEGGVDRGEVSASYVSTDVFTVKVVSGVVTYWQGAVLLYTSGATPTFPLLVDASIYHQSAAITATLHWGLVDATGLGFNTANDRCLDTNGSTGSIADGATVNLSPMSDFTLQARVYHPGFGATEYVILSKYDQNEVEYHLFYDNTVPAIYCQVSTDGSAVSTGSWAVTLSNSTWYHIAVTRDSVTGVMRCYVDSVEIGSAYTGVTGALYNGTADFHIGDRDGPDSKPWGEYLDEISIQSIVLTPSQIAESYLNGVNPSASGSEAVWHFDDDLLDETSNSNDLTDNGILYADAPALPGGLGGAFASADEGATS
jgi:hypothetical protein